jgi:hypothetical protein
MTGTTGKRRGLKTYGKLISASTLICGDLCSVPLGMSGLYSLPVLLLIRVW